MTSSSGADQKPGPQVRKEAIMKIIVEIFARKKKSQASRRRVDAVELLNNWTTRDWADLPVHHPRQD
jgi:hypothetical protein